MKEYIIFYKESVAKELRSLSQADRVLVVKKIQVLATNPYPAGVAKLQGSTGLYRVRQGDYRIMYEVNGRELVILVLKIGHRKEVYRNLPGSN